MRILVLLEYPSPNPLHSRQHFCSPPSRRRRKGWESLCRYSGPLSPGWKVRYLALLILNIWVSRYKAHFFLLFLQNDLFNYIVKNKTSQWNYVKLCYCINPDPFSILCVPPLNISALQKEICGDVFKKAFLLNWTCSVLGSTSLISVVTNRGISLATLVPGKSSVL